MFAGSHAVCRGWRCVINCSPRPSTLTKAARARLPYELRHSMVRPPRDVRMPWESCPMGVRFAIREFERWEVGFTVYTPFAG